MVPHLTSKGSIALRAGRANARRCFRQPPPGRDVNKSIIVSLVTGFLWIWVSLMFWASYPISSPVNEILIELFAKQGKPAIYSTVIHFSDFIVNLIIALPFAAVIKLLVINHSKLALLTVSSLALIYSIGSPFWSHELFTSWLFWWGIISHSIAIPVAYMLLSKIQVMGGLNNT